MVKEKVNRIQKVLKVDEEFNPESPNYLRFRVKVKGLSGGQLMGIQTFAEVLSIDADATPYPHLNVLVEIPKVMLTLWQEALNQ